MAERDDGSAGSGGSGGSDASPPHARPPPAFPPPADSAGTGLSLREVPESAALDLCARSDGEGGGGGGDDGGDDVGGGGAGGGGGATAVRRCEDGTDPDAGAPPDDEVRSGTVSSARFNLLSTMVGGGSLSLPLAFQQTGPAFGGPLTLLAVGLCSEFCMRCLVRACERTASSSSAADGDRRRKGSSSFEGIASEAFGSRALHLSMALVALICFFATVGYAVLLRDLLEPYTDYVVPPPDGAGGGPTRARNATMWAVVLAVTPLCLMTNLTALRHAGAASMVAVLVLGACVSYRSAQCNLGPDPPSDRHQHPRREADWTDYLTYVPPTFGDLASAFPIFVSCFICHYNVPPVHNELRDPTPERSDRVVSTTVRSACAFYLLIGFAGCAYGNCTAGGGVGGNVLLDFDEGDPLLLLGRTALALTVTLAFPMLVIPPRDICLRAVAMHKRRRQSSPGRGGGAGPYGASGGGGAIRRRLRSGGERLSDLFKRGRRNPPPSEAFPPSLDADAGFDDVEGDIVFEAMTEPLLAGGERGDGDGGDDDEAAGDGGGGDGGDGGSSGDGGYSGDGGGGGGGGGADGSPPGQGTGAAAEEAAVDPTARAASAVVIFWSAASAACLVRSIDVVWDLLGSTLSIGLGFLIPTGSYLALFPPGETTRREGEGEETEAGAERGAQEEGGEEEEGVIARLAFAAPGEEDYAGGPWGGGDRSRVAAWAVLGTFGPAMVVCTVNAFRNTFFRG